MAGVTADTLKAPSSFTLRPRMLRTLLWLRWQLLTRNYTRSVSSVIGAILLLLFLLPFVGFLTFGLVVLFNALATDHLNWSINILFYTFAGIYVLWAFLPLMQFNLNESLDVTKLTLYPLSQPELMGGLLISTLLDIPTLGIAILFVGVSIAWAHSIVQGLLIALVLVVAYIHIVALSQLLLSSLLGTLRSRRWRDLSVVLASVFSLSCYILSQFLPRVTAGNANAATSFINFDIGAWLQFLPPGMAARSISSFSGGDFVAGGTWLAVLIVTAFPVLWGWNRILRHALSTPEENGGGRNVGRRRRGVATSAGAASIAVAAPRASSTPALANGLIPPAVMAVALKDWHYVMRDPLYKRFLISAIYWIVILVLPSFQSGGRVTTRFVFIAPLFLVISLGMNSLGFEGKSFSTLALFPVRARDLLVGKNLVIFALGIAESIVLFGAQGFVTNQWQQLPLNAVALIGTMLVALGLSNVTAVLIPARVVQNSARVGGQQADAGSGFILALARMAAYIGVLILAAPIELAVLLPPIFHHEDLIPILVPLGLLYGIGVYVGGTAIAAGQYYNRVPEIIGTVVRE